MEASFLSHTTAGVKIIRADEPCEAARDILAEAHSLLQVLSAGLVDAATLADGRSHSLPVKIEPLTRSLALDGIARLVSLADFAVDLQMERAR